MSEHAEKTHAASAAIFAIVLAGLVFLLIGALSGGNGKAVFALPFLLLAAFYGVFALGSPKGAEAHDHH